MSFNAFQYTAPYAHNPLGARDAQGVPVKTSPPRTSEEQAAIDAFIKARGVRRVKPLESGLPKEDETRPNGGTHALIALALKNSRDMDQRIKKMIRHLMDHGPQTADVLAEIGGYSSRKSVHEAFKNNRYDGMVSRDAKNVYRPTAKGQGFAR